MSYYKNITSEVKIIALISPTLTSVSHVSLVPGEKLEVSTNLDFYVPHILGKFDSNNVDISNTVVVNRKHQGEIKDAQKPENIKKESTEDNKEIIGEIKEKDSADRHITKAKRPYTKLKAKSNTKIKAIKEKKPKKVNQIKKASKVNKESEAQ